MIDNSFTNLETSYTYRGRKISALYGSSAWHNFKKSKESIFQYRIGYVPLGFEQRPDLISDVFFDTPELWWLIMETNNAVDPFEDLKTGTRIRIPVNGL